MVKKTFRDGSYYRHVWFGKRTVKEGECAAIWTADGKRKVVEGPKRVRLFFSHVRFLNRHVADQHEYLELQFRDGHKEHQRGPLALFMDPCTHISMETKTAYKLAANEALVVYREEERAPVAEIEAPAPTAAAAAAGTATKPQMAERIGTPGTVQRRIVRGPAVFIPAAHEWVHTFSWHGTVSANGKGSKTGSLGDQKVPHALKFQTLRTQPDQMYVSVQNVRTTDDAQITVHLMLFFELSDIETMLNATNDPIGDFINAVSADVMTFGASNTYESMMQRTALLSDAASFPILKGRMAQTGFELGKIVYRGYVTSDSLQAMHDESIAKRTKLKLEADTRHMELEQAQHELQCKSERSRAECSLAEAELRHRLEMLELEGAQARKARDDDHEQRLKHDAALETALQQAQRGRNDEETRRDGALKELGVDLTQYLCVVGQRQPDHMTHIKLDTEKGASAPALHLDLNDGSKTIAKA